MRLKSFMYVSLTLVLGLNLTICCAATNLFRTTPLGDRAYVKNILASVDKVDSKITNSRQRLQHDYARWKRTRHISTSQRPWLTQLARKYRVEPNFRRQHTWNILLKRVDIIPASLALAQSINESDWGRSRFAREGRNYFGRWCYRSGCGLVPRRRPKGATYEVRKYPSMLASVQDYIYGLNVFPAYRALRDLRYQLRSHDKPISGIILAQGLVHYSQRGEAYVVSIKDLIQRYDLNRFDRHFA